MIVHLRKRLRGHLRGNASGSTLRLTLGCLLADQLRLKLRPVGASKRLTEDLSGDPSEPFITLSSLDAGDRDDLLAACRERLQQSAPGWDFTREHQLTHELGIGDTVVVEDGGIRAFALWHSAALVDARSAEELRLLKLFADSPGTFDTLLSALERSARSVGLRRVAVRCQTEYRAAYTRLMERGYRVRWTDLRMTLRGFPCIQASGGGEVLLSNWEI